MYSADSNTPSSHTSPSRAAPSENGSGDVPVRTGPFSSRPEKIECLGIHQRKETMPDE